MKISSIFESSFAIELAKDLAERQETLPPHKIIRKLVRFSIIGVVALAIVVSSIVMIRSSLGEDANTRQVLVFASFASALVLLSAIGAMLVTLWDGFMGQYIQRLALMDAEMAESKSDLVYDIPVVDLALSEAFILGDEDRHPTNVVLKVGDEEFIQDGDLSVAMVTHQLECLKDRLSKDDWDNYHLQDRLERFRALNEHLTVGRNLTEASRTLFATAVAVTSSPTLMAKYHMTGAVADMLGDIEVKIDEEPLVPNQSNQALAG